MARGHLHRRPPPTTREAGAHGHGRQGHWGQGTLAGGAVGGLRRSGTDPVASQNPGPTRGIGRSSPGRGGSAAQGGPLQPGQADSHPAQAAPPEPGPGAAQRGPQVGSRQGATHLRRQRLPVGPHGEGSLPVESARGEPRLRRPREGQLPGGPGPAAHRPGSAESAPPPGGGHRGGAPATEQTAHQDRRHHPPHTMQPRGRRHPPGHDPPPLQNARGGVVQHERGSGGGLWVPDHLQRILRRPGKRRWLPGDLGGLGSLGGSPDRCFWTRAGGRRKPHRLRGGTGQPGLHSPGADLPQHHQGDSDHRGLAVLLSPGLYPTGVPNRPGTQPHRPPLCLRGQLHHHADGQERDPRPTQDPGSQAPGVDPHLVSGEAPTQESHPGNLPERHRVWARYLRYREGVPTPVRQGRQRTGSPGGGLSGVDPAQPQTTLQEVLPGPGGQTLATLGGPHPAHHAPSQTPRKIPARPGPGVTGGVLGD